MFLFVGEFENRSATLACEGAPWTGIYLQHIPCFCLGTHIIFVTSLPTNYYVLQIRAHSQKRELHTKMFKPITRFNGSATFWWMFELKCFNDKRII